MSCYAIIYIIYITIIKQIYIIYITIIKQQLPSRTCITIYIIYITYMIIIILYYIHNTIIKQQLPSRTYRAGCSSWRHSWQVFFLFSFSFCRHCWQPFSFFSISSFFSFFLFYLFFPFILLSFQTCSRRVFSLRVRVRASRAHGL